MESLMGEGRRQETGDRRQETGDRRNGNERGSRSRSKNCKNDFSAQLCA
ncbi:MAG: hypothetical protein F6K18_11790 [Okeania sp. SIO2C2]|nr:hypothetical protein [Okeania sp. SIO2C2]NEP87452.1 hypothetical protein [Okeania sp. SIO2C2]